MTTKSQFSVCLGPAEQTAFERALLSNAGVLAVAFARIDVSKAQAGDPSDLEMILSAVEATSGGCDALNKLAKGQIQSWVRGVIRRMVRVRSDDDGLASCAFKLAQVEHLATSLAKMGDYQEAHDLYSAVIAKQTEFLGATSTDTLASRGNLSLVVEKLGKLDEAVSMLEDVVEIQTARAATDQIVSQHHRKSRMSEVQHNQKNLDMLRAKQDEAKRHQSNPQDLRESQSEPEPDPELQPQPEPAGTDQIE